MSISISIIIPTYNGVHKIANLLQALENQLYKDFEVIIVIDGSTDNTADYLAQQKFNLSNLAIISQENSGRAVSRNEGAKIAQGGLLLFFDDDMRPAQACVQEHLSHHRQHRQSICVGTQIDDYSKATSDIGRYKCYLSRKWEEKINTGNQPIGKNNLYLTAAHFSLPADMFRLLGGFDKRLRDGEDYELAIRAYRNNVPIYYNRQAFAWHDDFITCKSYIKRQREYTVWNQKINELKAGLPEKDFKRFDTSKTSYLKRKIFGFFSHRIWVWVIDNFNLLLILPRKIRYKLYDLIITGLSRHFIDVKID